MSKVVVITGAGSGLGRALAICFAERGDQVVLLGRTLAKTEAVAAKIGERATALACDVASAESVRGAFAAIAERHAGIDILINNAAIFTPSPIAEASDELILQTINTNLTGAIFCSRAAIPLLRPGGQIINISSESVELPFAHLAFYAASKAGLERFTLSLHDELEGRDVQAYYVRAGQMKGDGGQGIVDADPEVLSAFYQACLTRGLDLGRRFSTDFGSAARVIRTLSELPSDVRVVGIRLEGREARD